MIDEARTLELFGYTSDSLARASHKKVVAVCDGCGEARILTHQKYRALCLRCRMRTEETRRKIGEANRGKKLSDDHRRKISEAHRGQKHTDEAKKNMSKARKGVKLTDDHRRKMSEANKGEKGSNWQGGISFEPYCHKFNKAFKESIREKFGRVCFLCPMTEEENGKKLNVHHVNYDKNCLCDDVKCEFVPLCTSCHSKTNFNQGYWENLIINKLKNEFIVIESFINK